MLRQGPLSGQSFRTKDATGRTTPLRLTSLIATSGEGAVYQTDRAGHVAKMYNAPMRAHFRKLGIMLARPPRDPAAPGISIAWPNGIIERQNGAALGFLMPEISSAKRPTFLYVPKTRKKDAAGVDWYLLHSAALNLTKVFKAIHELGYVIGDVKPDNLLVDSQMRIFAIDTDSFQISDPATKVTYHCTVGTPEYTPPELMGREFKSIDRLIEHDNFGLAIIVYQFLFGRHPFSGGILDGPLEGLDTTERIKRGLWQWNKQRPLKPHAGSLPLGIVAPDLQHLFRRCFDRGHQQPSQRPAAKEWQDVLEKAIDNLAWCSVGPLHVHGSHSKSCPWCEAARSGSDLFPARPGISSTSYRFLTARFDHAAKTNLVLAETMLQRHARLQSDPAVAKQRAHVEKHRAELEALRRLKADLGKSEERDLIRRLQGNAMLRSLAAADDTIRTDIERLLKLAPILDELDALFAKAQPANGVYQFAAERDLFEAWKRHDVLKVSPRSADRHKDRINAAGNRVNAFLALQQAEAAADADATVAVLRAQGPALAELAEFRARRDHFDRLLRRYDQLADFIKAVNARPLDPIQACAIWEAHPDLPSSQVAGRPHAALKGQTPLAVYQRIAAARDAFLMLADQVRALADASPGIHEKTEKAIVACANEAERAHGPLPPLQQGRLQLRIEAAHQAVRNFAKLRRLAKRWPASGPQLVVFWRSIETRASYAVEADLRALIAEAEATFDRIDGFVALAAAQQPNEHALVAYADAHSDLAGLEMARAVRIAGRSIGERIELARDRVARLGEMERAVAVADAAATKTEAGERGIVDAWQLHAERLLPWTEARHRLEGRIQAATQRVRRGESLRQALAADSRSGIVTAWGSDDLLHDYAPAIQSQAAISRALKQTRIISELAAQLARNVHDDAAILRVTESAEREFGASMREPQPELGGRSLHDWVDLARGRGAFVARLAHLKDPGPDELLSIASEWRATFGTTHPAINRARDLLPKALELSARWSTLVGALQRGEDRRVVELWSDPHFRSLREATRFIKDIRSSIERYVQAADAFTAPNLGGVTPLFDGRLLLKWHWNDPRISHATIMLGDRSASARNREGKIERRVVTKAEFDAAGGAAVRFAGRLLTAMVCPGVGFRGEVVSNAAKRVLLHERGRRSLHYRVRADGIWFGKQEIELIPDRSFRLPRLKLVTEDAPEQSVVADLATVDMSDRQVVPLPGRVRPWSRKKTVRLQLEQQADAQWLEIIHPQQTERMMVVR